MNQTERERFGAYLRSLRTAQGLSQKDAGKLADVSCPYLAQLERGQRNPPSREILERLARAYTVEEERLLEAAGYRQARGDRHPDTLDPRRLDWAFNTVCRDPEFAFGTRMQVSQPTPEVKAFVVELYLRNSARKLLTDKEIEELEQMLHLDGVNTKPVE